MSEHHHYEVLDIETILKEIETQNSIKSVHSIHLIEVTLRLHML